MYRVTEVFVHLKLQLFRAVLTAFNWALGKILEFFHERERTLYLPFQNSFCVQTSEFDFSVKTLFYKGGSFFLRCSKLENVVALACQKDLQMISSLREATGKEGIVMQPLYQEQLLHKLTWTSKWISASLLINKNLDKVAIFETILKLQNALSLQNVLAAQFAC